MKDDPLSEEQILALKHIEISFSKDVNPICALGMGMGKTRVAYEIIKKHIESHEDKYYNILIVIKASNYSDPWMSHLTKNQNFSNIIYLHGKDRDNYLVKGKYDFFGQNIILTPYETLRLDKKNDRYELTEYFDLIIYDELHTIVNSKRLSLRIIELVKLKTHFKLALTGTPLENYIEEVGLLNIFMNDIDAFIELAKLSRKVKKEKGINKKDQIQAILDKGFDSSKNDDVIFHFIKFKPGIDRNDMILSVPIDERMLMDAESNYDNFSPKQRRFLSHPASVLKRINKELLPRCTKAEAVRYILQSTLDNEKIIIFSLYIDVINAYFKYCTELGYNSIRITGQDKGQKLEKKL